MWTFLCLEQLSKQKLLGKCNNSLENTQSSSPGPASRESRLYGALFEVNGKPQYPSYINKL